MARMVLAAAALGGLVAAGPAPASAAPIVIYDEDVGVVDGTPASTPKSRLARAAFDLQFASNVLVEDFESYQPGGQLPAVAPFGIPTATFLGPSGTRLARFDQAGSVVLEPLATSGSNAYGDDEDWLTVGDWTFPAGTIGDAPVDGFGFFGLGLDAPLTITVNWTDGSSNVIQVGNTLSQRAIFFWGVYDPARQIESVTGGMPINVGDGFYQMDDLVVGIAEVPAPSALVLFGSGLVVLAGLRRRAA